MIYLIFNLCIHETCLNILIFDIWYIFSVILSTNNFFSKLIKGVKSLFIMWYIECYLNVLLLDLTWNGHGQLRRGNHRNRICPRATKSTLDQLKTVYSGMLNSFKSRMSRRGNFITYRHICPCPLCQQPGHTREHLFNCPANPVTPLLQRGLRRDLKWGCVIIF